MKAGAVRVAWVVIPGIDLETSLAARRLAAGSDGRALWSAGLHPHDASKWLVEGDRIEALAAEGITGGCGAGNYCPSDPVTRGQMAVFLVRAFEL